MIELRPYQTEIVSLTSQALREPYKNRPTKAVMVVAPTGSGKTVIFSYIAQKCREKGMSVLIVAHRRELLKQCSDKLNQFGLTHSFIAAGYSKTIDNVYVASVDTLINRLGQYPKFDIVIVDEGHHAIPGNKWGKVIEYCLFHGVKAVMAFTATAVRPTGEGLGIEVGGFFEKLVSGPQMIDLINQGWLTPYKFIEPKFDFQAELDDLNPQNNMEYNRKVIADLMGKPAIYGDAVELYREHLDGRLPTIAFCANVEKTIQCAEMFNKAGHSALSVDGKMGVVERDRAIHALSIGKISVLTSCEIISEGTDIPIAFGAIDLQPTMSIVKLMQKQGRISRLYEGGPDFDRKEFATYIDMVGNSMRMNVRHDTRHEWDLNVCKVKKKRKKKLEEEEVEMEVSQCPGCRKWIDPPASKCPFCGHISKKKVKDIKSIADAEFIVYESEEQKVKILEIVAKTEVKIEAQTELKKERGRARTLLDLYCLAHLKGYKMRWAERLYDSRPGCTLSKELIKGSQSDFEEKTGVKFSYQKD